MAKWRLDNHIVGKTYDLTQDNMSAMIKSIEELKVQNARYRDVLEFTVDMLKACQPWVTSYGVRHDSEKALEKAHKALKGTSK
jgi:hypothetical protein